MVFFICLIVFVCMFVKICKQENITCQYAKPVKVKPKPNYPIIERKVVYKEALWMEKYLENRVDEIQNKMSRQGALYSFYVGDLDGNRKKAVLEWIVTLPTTKLAYLEDDQIRCANF